MLKIISLYKTYREQLLYLFFGGLTTLVNIVIFAINRYLFHLALLLANVIAWFCAIMVAYLCNKNVVFQVKCASLTALVKEFLTFLLSRLLTLGADSLLLYLGVEVLKIMDMPVKIFANVVVIILNYILAKCFIFKK